MNNEQDPRLELDPDAEARVTDALDYLGTVEPPAEFVGQVMWRTRHQALKQNSQRRATRQVGEGTDMAKKVLIGVIGVAAAGLLVAYVFGYPPASHTEGTIGAAQRYQAEQIKNSDVKVTSPELQAFIQTDAFDKLIHDKQAMAALANPEVTAALANPAFVAALADPQFQLALAASEVRLALSNAQIVQALATPEHYKALADPKFQASLSAQGAQAALASPALKNALANPALYQDMISPAFQLAMSNAAFQQAMLSPAFQAAMAAP